MKRERERIMFITHLEPFQPKTLGMKRGQSSMPALHVRTSRETENDIFYTSLTMRVLEAPCMIMCFGNLRPATNLLIPHGKALPVYSFKLKLAIVTSYKS
jgi:hypothetical protein